MTAFPVMLEELGAPDVSTVALFRRRFGSIPPDFPRHFVARRADGADARACAYVHFTAVDPGMYLCGGLCVDTAVYRELSADQRSVLATHGSLSRWLLSASIAALGKKGSVFAYTGDVRSARDILALGFQRASGRFLFVRWFEEAVESRAERIRQATALGPF